MYFWFLIIFGIDLCKIKHYFFPKIIIRNMLVYFVDHYFVLCYKNNKPLKLQHLLNSLKIKKKWTRHANMYKKMITASTKFWIQRHEQLAPHAASFLHVHISTQVPTVGIRLTFSIFQWTIQACGSHLSDILLTSKVLLNC